MLLCKPSLYDSITPESLSVIEQKGMPLRSCGLPSFSASILFGRLSCYAGSNAPAQHRLPKGQKAGASGAHNVGCSSVQGAQRCLRRRLGKLCYELGSNLRCRGGICMPGGIHEALPPNSMPSAPTLLLFHILNNCLIPCLVFTRQA